jgi:hypothetical protein
MNQIFVNKHKTTKSRLETRSVEGILIPLKSHLNPIPDSNLLLLKI